jgi:hypothetical protein
MIKFDWRKVISYFGNCNFYVNLLLKISQIQNLKSQFFKNILNSKSLVFYGSLMISISLVHKLFMTINIFMGSPLYPLINEALEPNWGWLTWLQTLKLWTVKNNFKIPAAIFQLRFEHMNEKIYSIISIFNVPFFKLPLPSISLNNSMRKKKTFYLYSNEVKINIVNLNILFIYWIWRFSMEIYPRINLYFKEGDRTFCG